MTGGQMPMTESEVEMHQQGLEEGYRQGLERALHFVKAEQRNIPYYHPDLNKAVGYAEEVTGLVRNELALLEKEINRRKQTK
jgi:hypothetical protein